MNVNARLNTGNHAYHYNQGKRMTVLRPILELAAETYRNSVEFAYAALVDTVSDDERGWVWRPDPAELPENIRFVPSREGKSLLSPVKKRFFFKRHIYPTWSDE